MAEVMVETRTRRKRTLQIIKTNFLLMFKDPWRRKFVRLTWNQQGPRKERKREAKHKIRLPFSTSVATLKK